MNVVNLRDCVLMKTFRATHLTSQMMPRGSSCLSHSDRCNFLPSSTTGLAFICSILVQHYAKRREESYEIR